jgi:tight adherence protein B
MIASVLTAMLAVFAIGGTYLAFAGSGSDKAKKRMVAVARPQGALRGGKGAVDPAAQRRKNVTVMLKELEKRHTAQNKRPSLRRRIEQAGLVITPRMFWTWSAVAGILAAFTALVAGQHLIVIGLVGFATALGLPRWVLIFLKGRREKAFTREFASAIDIIVRSVKSGLPVSEALKVVASEIPDPVAGEFKILNEGLKVGVSMDQGLKRMFERMPTAEVNFFGIVMTIQQKSGGNLSEALQNLANVLRDRKRLQGKIRAMSSEAKASAMIIGSLPPGVMTLIYITTPAYMSTLFTTQLGNLMLGGCVVWMFLGILVMKKMVSFKF